MPYTTYNQFRTAVQLMLDGDEVASVIQPQTIDTLIGLGEGMIYLGSDVLPPLRASTMQAEFADVESDGNEVADNAVELPEDFLELVIAYFDPEKPLEVLSEAELRPKLSWGGEPTYVAQAGESLIFAGAAADGDALLGRYYARPAPLKTALNATFHRYDELFLYAALVCAAPFMGQSAKIPVWRSYYSALLNQANHTERMRAYAGSRLRVRAR
jgi:hypothetical protein